LRESSDPGLQRLPLLDAIRGFCVLQVLLWHYPATLHRLGGPAADLVIRPLWTVLDWFFVLSGFLLGGILLENRGTRNLVPVFYARRALRILPVYLILLAYHWWLHPDDGVLKYLGFTQNIIWAAQQGWGTPEISVTWSLAVEEQFYLVLPLLVAFLPRAWVPRVAAALVVIAPLTRAYMCLEADNMMAASILAPCRMDTLFMGVLLAWVLRDAAVVRRIEANRRRLGRAVLLLGCVFLLYTETFDAYSVVAKTVGHTYNGIFFAALLVWLMLVFPTQKLAIVLRVLSWVGLGAYPIYLSHVAIASAVRSALGTGMPALLATALTITALSLISWHCIEKPCIRLGKRLRYGTPLQLTRARPTPA
jgi:peptidoglycan/LPS O-acetylase OafA/YrhL